VKLSLADLPPLGPMRERWRRAHDEAAALLARAGRLLARVAASDREMEEALTELREGSSRDREARAAK